MNEQPRLTWSVLSWLYAALWILLLLLLFSPLLIAGYLLRAVGTWCCNGAYRMQEFMAYLGEKANTP